MLTTSKQTLGTQATSWIRLDSEIVGSLPLRTQVKKQTNKKKLFDLKLKSPCIILAVVIITFAIYVEILGL